MSQKSREKTQKIKKTFFHKTLDKWGGLWYTNDVKGIEMSADRVMANLRSAKATKKNKKIIENPLTNPLKYDTIRVSRGESRLAESNRQRLALAVKMKIKAPLKKNVKNLLTTIAPYGIMRAREKENSSENHEVLAKYLLGKI